MDTWTLYILVMGIVFGAILGSYLTMVWYRLPRRIDLARGGSRCPSCGTPLTALDNVPILGYLVHRGRCRHCAARIPIRYLLIEVITAVAFTLIALINCWVAVGLFAAAVLIPAIIQWTLMPATRRGDSVGRIDPES